MPDGGAVAADVAEGKVDVERGCADVISISRNWQDDDANK